MPETLAIPRSASPFDLEILRLVANGGSDAMVARSLDVSTDRVKRAVRAWLVKLGAANRTEAVVRAVGLHLLEIRDLQATVAAVVDLRPSPES